MLKQQLENVRKKAPLIQNITNYVTVNDCANILLACGGSPIMSDEPKEVEEVASICNGLNINIGTLQTPYIQSMFLAGKQSNALDHPVVLDPVGAGASKLRTKTVKDLIEEVQFTTIRGNISEIMTLALGIGNTKGVDADSSQAVTEENLEQVIAFTKAFAEETKSVIAISGAIDIVANQEKAYIIRNGHPMMSRVTGTGCMLSAMIGAYLAANKETPLEATVACVCAMGIAGETAYERLTTLDGNASYRNYIIDAIYNLDGDTLERKAKYEVR